MVDVRLIDANALKAKLYSLLKIEEAPPRFIEGLETALAVADVAPTIDAVPVVHARWLPRGSDDNDAGMYYCSACKDERYFGDEVITSEEASKYCPFCPNCGAKMDGGAEG